MSGLELGADGRMRCWWGVGDEEYQAYHDREWGRPETEDDRLFEKVVLEGFQAGLAWITILRKRENFRSAFAGFVPADVARFGESDVERLLHDAGIVRHEGKIRSAIANAGRALDLMAEHGSLASYFWAWAPPQAGPPRGVEDLPATTDRSTALSKDLKKRGWTFVGPTTVYAFMQAMGLVNDHIDGCSAREACEAARLPVLAAHSISS